MALASHISAERQCLEAVDARYEKWSATTASIRETAARAQDELGRRGFIAGAQEPDGHLRLPPQMTGVGQFLSLVAKVANRVAAERQARPEYSAHVEREFQSQPKPGQEIEAQYDAEIEL